ncbi:MAG TPA: RNA methyltransferase [Actinomycetales bacterium]|nr:RNA methyltransferase [Actinomycetales bacterium]
MIPAHEHEHDAGREVGVGPFPGGREAWPADPRLDPELLEHGDARNVEDRFRYWSLEAIVAELDTQRSPLQIAIENLGHDFNIGSVVRTANAFNVAAVHVVGRRRWNRRGAMVTDRYLHVHHHPDVAAFVRSLPTIRARPVDDGAHSPPQQPPRAPRLPLIGIDNIPGSIPLEGAELPRECVLVFGEEAAGLSAEMAAACDRVHHISQHGSTRSMNVGAAAAIAMYEWARQHL